MPLLFHRYLQPEGELGLWRIEEPAAFFLDQFVLHEEEKKQIETLKGHRRLEWLAGRWLLHLMSGREQRGACLKDEFGKPYLSQSLFDISISHSREMASVLAAPRAVGVDIQRIVGKIELIAHKYMRDEEMESLETASRLAHLHVYWGAKEALYKAYGRRQLDFKTHIFIEPFAYDVSLGECWGYVKKEDYHQKFRLNYEQIEDYILVTGMEDLGDVRLA
ncbi:MAG: 4'-phosphopantetheinyl transferase superfamily protein [Bacteroidota bacterium]